MNRDQIQREILKELGLCCYVLAPRTNASLPGAPVTHSFHLPLALLQALARAGGCTPSELDSRPELAEFRSDPAGKRAFWPILRRLRGGRR